MELDKIKLGKLLRELEKMRGRHTELVSYYIPAGSDLNNAAELINQEQALTRNVKNKTVRKHGAEVRVSRAKSRVVAKRKAALDAHRQKRVKDTPARHGPEGGKTKKAPVRHAADAGLAPEKKRTSPSREARKIQKKEKIRRTSSGREPGVAVRVTEASGRKKRKRGRTQ